MRKSNIKVQYVIRESIINYTLCIYAALHSFYQLNDEWFINIPAEPFNYMTYYVYLDVQALFMRLSLIYLLASEQSIIIYAAACTIK